MYVERDIRTVDRAVDEPVAVVETPVAGAPPAVTPVYTHVDRHAAAVASSTTAVWSPPAIVGGIFAIVLLVLGGVILARAGFDGPWDQPVVDVAGMSVTAVEGAAAVVGGLGMLIAALTRSRSGLLLMSILLGVLAIIALIEPSMGDSGLSIDGGFAALVTVGSIITGLVALFAPTVRRHTAHIEDHLAA